MRKSLIAALCFTVCITHGLAASRVALVIGVNSYRQLPENHQLTSPVNDAKDVAAALAGLGYTLITGAAVTEADREGITSATEAFANAARGAEAAVFYFSGHGIQVGEDNYLLPADTPRLTGYSVLKNRAVLLRDSVMTALEEAAVPNKVIILDCCRDNPFSAQLESALSQVGKSLRTKSVGEITGYGPGFYLAFATSPGQRADDGNGARNSPFTEALLKAVPSSAGKDIDFFFRDVKTHLSAEQVSWTNHSLKDTFSLAPGSSGAAGGMVKSSPQAPEPSQSRNQPDQPQVPDASSIRNSSDKASQRKMKPTSEPRGIWTKLSDAQSEPFKHLSPDSNAYFKATVKKGKNITGLNASITNTANFTVVWQKDCKIEWKALQPDHIIIGSSITPDKILFDYDKSNDGRYGIWQTAQKAYAGEIYTVIPRDYNMPFFTTGSSGISVDNIKPTADLTMPCWMLTYSGVFQGYDRFEDLLGDAKGLKAEFANFKFTMFVFAEE